MMSWKNLKLAKKFAVGFGIMILLIVAVGILSFQGVSKLVGNTEHVIAMNGLGATLTEKEIDHLNWVNQVSELLTNEEVTELAVQTDHEKCAFGSWLYGDGRTEAERLHSQTDKAVLASFGATSFGNIARVPAPQLREPKGIRDLEEWYMSQLTRPEYLREIFDRQCEIGLADLERVHAAVGEKITAVMVTGTDFGMQTGAMTSPPLYRDLYQPVHRRVNDWIHANTTWKTFIHSCGSVRELLDDFIDAGFDILNPVQCSACGMDPRELKEEYGGRIAFWGGGVDTQKTLPFGTPDEVEAEVRDRIAAFGPGGGFIFNPVHNVQALTPVENLTRMYETVRRAGGYPL